MTRAPARPAPHPTLDPLDALAGNGLRIVLLTALVLAPLLFGAFFPWVFGPLHAVAYTSGLLLFWRSRRLEAGGGSVPPLPAGRALVAFAALVVLQLVPLPPRLLRLLSPGTFEFHEKQMLVPLTVSKPISVSPADTLFGLLYLVGMAFLYLAVSRAFEGTWRRRLLRAVIYVGMFMTFVALVQKASGTDKIYGIMGIKDSWAAFGPYLSRSHFAGYLLMPIGLALGLTSEALAELQRAWTRRRVGWLALGDPVGSVVVRRGAEAMVLIVGLVAAASRGAFVGFVFLLLVFAALTRRRLLLAGVGAVALVGVSWIGLDAIIQGFVARGIEGSRLALWRDTLRMFPDFPLFGVGWNGFAMAYYRYQTVWRPYFFQAAHNEYLDLLLTTGLLGVALALWALVEILPRAVARALRSPADAGLLAGLAGVACHNLVDFNWQIQANAATFAALLGLAVRPLDRSRTDP